MVSAPTVQPKSVTASNRGGVTSNPLSDGRRGESSEISSVDVVRDVERLAAGTTHWMSANVGYLDPSYPGLPVTPKVKAGLELGLLCRLWTRWRPDDENLASVTAAVHRIWQDPNFPVDLTASPEYFQPYALIYGALAPPGVDGFHRATLAQLAPDGHLKPYGKSPYVRLENRYYADLAGLNHEFESYRQLYEASILAHPPAGQPTDIEAYRITHTVFHLSDFGARDMELTADERSRACQIIDRMTDQFVEVDYWDLIAELIFSQACLEMDPTRTRSGVAAIYNLLRAQTPSGAIPGRYIAQRVDESVPQVEFFRKSFHTTLVSALTSMMILTKLGR